MTHVLNKVWMGLPIKVITSKNLSLVGLEGVVVDETQNMIKMETKQGIRNVQKSTGVFAIDGHRVVGSEVVLSPHERMKIKVTN